MRLLAPSSLPARGGARAATQKWHAGVADLLTDMITASPTATLTELAHALRTRHNIDVSRATVSRWLVHRCGLRRRVVCTQAPARQSARVVAARETFARETQPSLPAAVAHGLVLFADESHVDRRSAQRRHGRAPRGQQVVVSAPANGGTERERHTLVRAVGVRPVSTAASDGNQPPYQLVSVNRVLTAGSNDAIEFRSWLEQDLVPAAHALRVEYARRRGLSPPPPPLPLEDDAASITARASKVPPVVGARQAAAPSRRAPRVLSFHHGLPDMAATLTRQPAVAPRRRRVMLRSRRRATADSAAVIPPVVVVLDNWRGHHARQVTEALQRWSRTVRFVFVPAYSPDLN